MPRLVRPIQEFLRTETGGGLLLLLAAVAALIWVNTFANSYHDFWSVRLALDLNVITFDESLAGWINDGLMAIFFYVVGLEIKSELLQGELAAPRRAALPVLAALGGMVVPALIFLSFNAGRAGSHGWGIPMATDIAFSVGVLSLLGSRVPLSLKVFLLALAIVDDLGAIVVIAVFYTDSLALGWLAAALGVFVLAAALGRAGVRGLWVYVAVGALAWLCVYESGVHATIAGVVLGLLTPIAPHLGGGKRQPNQRPPLPGSRSPLDRMEHALHPWTSFVIIPLFALANAGIEINGALVHDAVRSPISRGVALGLVVGKPVGITLFAFLAVRTGLATLPAGVTWLQILAVGMIAGIGFTVSIFISNLAFANAQFIDEAKLAILAGSLVIALLGVAVLLALSRGSRVDSS